MYKVNGKKYFINSIIMQIYKLIIILQRYYIILYKFIIDFAKHFLFL